MLARFRGILRDRHYQPLNKILISKKRLAGNYKYLCSVKPGVQIAPVLKSNAYGHGLQVMGPLVDQLHPPFICVDSLFEANILKSSGVKTPILIMGYVDTSSLQTTHLPYSFTIFGLEMAKALNKYQKRVPIHIFVDTGMHREGVTIEELPRFLSEIRKLKNLRIEGLMSHFASADDIRSDQTAEQVANFKVALEILRKWEIEPKWRHISASNGLFLADNSLCNLARVGKSLYGIDPRDRKNSRLKPILRMTTKIAEVKQLRKGDRVGYNATFIAPKDMTIGVLPIGYNDGVDRRLSNVGSVFIGDKKCPIIGRVSMNVTTIELPRNVRATEGQEVLVVSSNSNDPNSVINIAKDCQTISHEVLVHFAVSTRREVV